MARIEITEDELITALLAAGDAGENDAPHNAKTARQLIEMTGRSESWLYRQLHALKNDGRLGVTKVWVEALNGVRRRVDAYYVREINEE